MRAAATIVLALSALVCVNAFAGSFFTAIQYPSGDCTGTATASSNTPYPIDECVASTGLSASSKTTVTGGALTSSTWATAKDCSGTPVTPAGGNSSTAITNGYCQRITSSLSIKYTFPIASAPIYSLTSFSASGCAAANVQYGPQYSFGLTPSCLAGLAVTMINGPLQICLTTCNADCTNIPTGSCQDAPSGGSGSVIYYSNGVGAQAVVTYATAALIAVAAVVLSL